MQCPRCHTENREGRRFCGECGFTFASTCPSCGFLNESSEKFCGGCGAALIFPSAAAAVAKPEAPSIRFSEAERRQLTVMFCDLVGSTELATRLDPEILREVVRSYQQASGDVISRLQGHIAQYLGDGLLVYFGFPAAHEDDAQRAVRAALGIVESVALLNVRLHREHGVKLAIRIGIHTGLVVVGEMGGSARREELALGETPNVAARLQALAEPDTVVISAATYRLVHGAFVCLDVGVHAVKGLPAALHVYRVQGGNVTSSPVEITASGFTPLVGREEEVGLLVSRWEQAKDGHGQVVLLSGEPGIGKSRLVRVLKERVSGESHARWECRCSAYHQESALYPVIDLFERALEFGREDSLDEKIRKIETGLARYGLSQAEATALWASLLSVPLSEHHPPLNLTPQRQKQKTFEAIVALLLALSADRPLLFIVEDLHWADPSTRELLDFILGQVPAASLLMLLTARPEFRAPWANRGHVTHLTVNRVTRRQTEQMVERITGGKPLPDEVLRQVAAKTDGVPLFVEELTKTVLESGLLREQDDRYELTGALPPLAIPSTLQDSLMARLDRLATIKEVAQVGAALGRTFHYELLRTVSSIDDTTLQRALAGLAEAELLHQRGVAPDATYIFKHALIQETAYQSMLISRRQQLHQRIAEILSRQFPATAETQPELLAHHYTEAGLAAEAIDSWRRAGQRAVERSANVEAIAHLTSALQALDKLPKDRERLELELELQTALGPALMATKGLGAVEVERAYARALALCRELGDTEHLFEAQRGLWEFYELRGDLSRARELAEELLILAGEDPALRLVAHDVLGDTLFWLGEFTASLEHLEHGIALYDPAQHQVLAQRHGGYDPGVACRSFAAYALWYLGYPDRALRQIEAAVALGVTHRFSGAFPIEFAAYVHHYRREAERCRERTDSAMALFVEQSAAFFLGHATVMHGWVLAQQGQLGEGIAEIRRGMELCRGSGAELERPHWLALLAEACLMSHQIEEGLAAVTEALAQVDRTGARFNEAELCRLRGELLLAACAFHLFARSAHAACRRYS